MTKEHSEERDEDRAEQQQEALVRRQLDGQGAEDADRRGHRDEQSNRELGEEVLQRDRRGVGVRERVVRLADRQREQRRQRHAARGDGGQEPGRLGEVAREQQDRAEREQQHVRERVADPVPPESARAEREKRV